MAGVGPQPGYGVVNQQYGNLRYAAKRGNLFRGVNQAVVATAMTAGLPTTYTGGLVLANPTASTVHLSILEAGFAFIAAQANASVIGLGVAQSGTALTGTLTAVPIQNALVGSSATPVAKLYSSATITLPVAPVLSRILTTVDTGALTTGLNEGPGSVNINGGIELIPGAYCVFLSSATGTASSFLGSFTWQEVPLGA
jgi:hypothetical protein